MKKDEKNDIIKDIYINRPFKIRNADEFNQNDILSLFVDPTDSLKTPFEFENTIIRGRMGTGKTMILRANHAFYSFELVPRLMSNAELILPVFIKLSDFQHLKDPNKIYCEIIIKIIEEILSIYLNLQDAKKMANIHAGMQRFPYDKYFDSKIKETANFLLKLGAEEYVNRITNDFSINGDVNYGFFRASASAKKVMSLELKRKDNPSIQDINYVYKLLFENCDGKILLLLDEASSLDKSFFRSDTQVSLFEILMNQLRTCSFIRTKIAIYPNTYSDILTETRYGDTIILDSNISNRKDYLNYRKKVDELLINYIKLNNNTDTIIGIDDIFEVDINNNLYGDCIEQIINGSNGNIRRLIHLLDLTMVTAYNSTKGRGKGSTSDALEALKSMCHDNINRLFSDEERKLLYSIGKVCKSRRTFRFQFPKNSTVLTKFINRSNEFNILTISEPGSGRKANIYTFDYSFCVYYDIPTHIYIDKNTEKIDPARTIASNGSWISKVTKITDETILHSQMPGKIEGTIIKLTDNKGFLSSEDGNEYYFSFDDIIESDRNKQIFRNMKMRFNPLKINDAFIAYDVEVLL